MNNFCTIANNTFEGSELKWIMKSKVLFARLKIANITTHQTIVTQVISRLVTSQQQAHLILPARLLNAAVIVNADKMNKEKYGSSRAVFFII